MNKRTGFVLSAILILLGATLATLPAARAQASWFDQAWAYRCPVIISNPTGGELTDYQVQVVLDSSFNFSNARADGGDLRVTDSDGTTAISFWTETWDSGGQTASIWVKVPIIPSAGTTIYLYYGNATATSLSDGLATFETYDGFEDNDVGGPPASPSGAGYWTKYAGNPVISCGRCAFGSVFLDGDTGVYHSFVSWTTILHYTSTNGIDWNADVANNPVLTASQSWEGSNVGVPMAWKEDGTWYMLYRGGSPPRIGLATSTDAIGWTKSISNPVLSGTPGQWDDTSLDPWGVIKVDDTYYLWYNTIGGAGRSTGLATSTNLTDWTKDPNNPIFTGGRFCAFPFRYDGSYYLLIPHYTSGTDYSQIELYRDSNPTFYSGDREYLGVAIDYGPTDWDDHDQDTPCVLTDDIYRDTYAASGNELWVYYAGEGGDGAWDATGMCIEEDIAAAIAGVQAPDLTWSTAGVVTVTDAPVRQGVRSARQNDTSAGGTTELIGGFSERGQAAVAAWMRRDSASSGDYDVYLYDGGRSGTLAAVGGLGRDGVFHYWDGTFHDTGVSWAIDTWYLVTLGFTGTADLYDFVAYDASLTELVRVGGVSFGNASASAIDTAMLYTSGGYVGNGYADDFRVRNWVGSEPDGSVGPEEGRPTAVTVASFAAEPGADQIILTWETGFEVDTLGFNLYRSLALSGAYVRLNEALIHSQAPGSPLGAVYTWVDRGVEPGTIYYYKLEDLDAHGVSTLHGPVWAVAELTRFYFIYLPFVWR